MTMHNPPHPGEFIREVYLEPFGLSARHLAMKSPTIASSRWLKRHGLCSTLCGMRGS